MSDEVSLGTEFYVVATGQKDEGRKALNWE